jgi:hypothetical protein
MEAIDEATALAVGIILLDRAIYGTVDRKRSGLKEVGNGSSSKVI